MDFMPKYILKGKNSDGSSSRTELWDFPTIATIETGGYLFLLVVGFMTVPFIAPLLALFSMIKCYGRAPFLNLIIMFFSAYFLYDCVHGMLAIVVLSWFFTEENINIIVGLNVAAFTLSAYFLIFSGLIYSWVFSPYNATDEESKLKASEKVETNFVALIVFVIILTCIMIGVGYNTGAKHKGWVQYNTVTKDVIQDKKDLDEAIRRSNENYDKQKANRHYGPQ
jgi:multisubunit Na+/H+ antiporter MnhC subunit